MKDELKEGERLLSKHHKSLIKEQEKEVSYWRKKIDEIKEMETYQLTHTIHLMSEELHKRVIENKW